MAVVAGAGAVGLSLAFAPFAGCGGNAFTAGTGDDGGPPPPPAVDAGPGFCASLDAATFQFCSDFDHKALPENWDSVIEPGTAALSEDPDAGSPSPPNALLGFAPAQDLVDGGTNGAVITKSGLPKGAVHIAMEMRLDELKFPSGAASSPSSVVPLLYTQGKTYELLLAFTPPSAGATLSFELIELAQELDGGTTGTAHPLTGLISQNLSQFQALHIDFDIDKVPGAAVTANISLGGESTQVTLNPPISAAAGDRTLTLGVEAIGQVDEVRIHFDNVTYAGGD
jgi:hypothetical protein